MRIAVDASCDRNLMEEVFCHLAKEHGGHQFIFLVGGTTAYPLSLPANVQQIIVPPTPTNLLSKIWGYYVKIPAALKKCKADVFISTNGVAAVPASLPQIVFAEQFFCRLVEPTFNSYFNQKLTPVFFKKATIIATSSDYVKSAIAYKYKIEADKIKTVGTGVSYIFTSLEWEQREEIKEKYAKGCEYFICIAGFNPSSNLINTLKAFSIFKKWQKTNMKLLIVGQPEKDHSKQVEKLKTYKYRNEINTLDNIGEVELASVIGAAYAMVFAPSEENTGAPVLQAMQCKVPVITSGGSVMSEFAGDAALYVHPANPTEIAEQMKLIFKDEQLRTRLVQLGNQRSLLYTWEKTRSLTWQLIEAAVSK